jgi:HSP20 family molecular chaperone IbpA
MSVLTFTVPPHLFDGNFFSTPFHHTTTAPATGCKKAQHSSVVLDRRVRDHTITKTEDAFHLFVDLPRVKAADFSLQIDDGILKLSGSRKFGRGVAGQQQSCSTFAQSFSIVEADVDTSKITANLADGVLAVILPKKVKPVVVAKSIMVTENPHDDWVAVDDNTSKEMDTADEGNTLKKEQDDEQEVKK